MKRSKNLNLNNRYIEQAEIKEHNTIYTGCWGFLTQLCFHPIRLIDPFRTSNSDPFGTGNDFVKEPIPPFILSGDNIYFGYI